MSQSEGLGRYGVTAPTIVREPARDTQAIPICPECGHVVQATKRSHPGHNPDVVDRATSASSSRAISSSSAGAAAGTPTTS